MHGVRNLPPPLDLQLVPDPGGVRDGCCCAGGDGACFADNQRSGDYGALRVVDDCHGELNVVFVGAETG